jgi:hypothetical protein
MQTNITKNNIIRYICFVSFTTRIYYFCTCYLDKFILTFAVFALESKIIFFIFLIFLLLLFILLVFTLKTFFFRFLFFNFLILKVFIQIVFIVVIFIIVFFVFLCGNVDLCDVVLCDVVLNYFVQFIPGFHLRFLEIRPDFFAAF